MIFFHLQIVDENLYLQNVWGQICLWNCWGRWGHCWGCWGHGCLKFMEVTLLSAVVTSLQKSKSLRVVPHRFFSHWSQFQQCLVRTDSQTDGRRDIATYWAVLGQLKKLGLIIHLKIAIIYRIRSLIFGSNAKKTCNSYLPLWRKSAN